MRDVIHAANEYKKHCLEEGFNVPICIEQVSDDTNVKTINVMVHGPMYQDRSWSNCFRLGKK